jgi:hypothetical protein
MISSDTVKEATQVSGDTVMCQRQWDGAGQGLRGSTGATVGGIAGVKRQVCDDIGRVGVLGSLCAGYH